MIYLGADHRGIGLKAKIAKWLTGRGFEFEDLGAYEYIHDDDFVDYAIRVAERVGEGKNSRGIVICGSGVGASIAANKVKGARCGLGFIEDQVHAARKEDNINILALAADNFEEEMAFKLVEKFLNTEFVEYEKYLRRIEKISRYER